MHLSSTYCILSLFIAIKLCTHRFMSLLEFSTIITHIFQMKNLKSRQECLIMYLKPTFSSSRSQDLSPTPGCSPSLLRASCQTSFHVLSLFCMQYCKERQTQPKHEPSGNPHSWSRRKSWSQQALQSKSKQNPSCSFNQSIYILMMPTFLFLTLPPLLLSRLLSLTGHPTSPLQCLINISNT